MKKILFVLMMAFPLAAPLAAQAQSEHGGKPVSSKGQASQANKAAEHAGQAVKRQCDPATEDCGNSAWGKAKAAQEHGGQPAQSKPAEHGGKPMTK